MAGVYHPRHPERTVLYRVFFHCFDRFLCPDCYAEHLLMFSCRTRGFCPSCHAKRLEEWAEWTRPEFSTLARMDYLEFIAHVTLPWEETSGHFSALFGLSANPWRALTHFELNLTSDGIPIYPSLRWGEAKLSLERSFGWRSTKRISYISRVFFVFFLSPGRKGLAILRSFGTPTAVWKTAPHFPAILDVFSIFCLLFSQMTDGKVVPYSPIVIAKSKNSFSSFVI